MHLLLRDLVDFLEVTLREMFTISKYNFIVIGYFRVQQLFLKLMKKTVYCRGIETELGVFPVSN